MSTLDFEAIGALKGEGVLTLDAERTAFVVVDVQRYFVNPEHALGQMLEKVLPEGGAEYFKRVRDIVIPNLQQLIEGCGARDVPVYYTAFGSLRAAGRDLAGWARRANTISEQVAGGPMYPPATDPAWQIHDRVAPASEERTLAKTTSGALGSTDLEQMLRSSSRDTVVVAGLTTDVCVAQTARELADRDFAVVVPEDACATVRAHLHQASLETFALVFGRVSDTRSVLQALKA